MNALSRVELADKIIEKARCLGATVAGITDLEPLKVSPSHRIFPKIGMNLKAHHRNWKDTDKADKVAWPENAVSAVVIGVVHNANEPELDWWDGKGTPGNRILIRINKKLSEWIERKLTIKTHKLPYMIEKGGIFLKDAAVRAGLGRIGKNNLVITPAYGPRIRFRALLLERKVEPTGPLEFNPCEDCNQPCRKACPVKAYKKIVYSAEALAQSTLPGIDGTYDRVTCNIKMEKDIADALRSLKADDLERIGVKKAIEEFEEDLKVEHKVDKTPQYCVKYCRRCELACPVGKQETG